MPVPNTGRGIPIHIRCKLANDRKNFDTCDSISFGLYRHPSFSTIRILSTQLQQVAYRPSHTRRRCCPCLSTMSVTPIANFHPSRYQHLIPCSRWTRHCIRLPRRLRLSMAACGCNPRKHYKLRRPPFGLVLRTPTAAEFIPCTDD